MTTPTLPHRPRIVAITSGCDWADAACDHVVVPEDLDLREARKYWQAWYEDEYLPRLQAMQRPEYIDFVRWLTQKYGAEPANIETFSA